MVTATGAHRLVKAFLAHLVCQLEVNKRDGNLRACYYQDNKDQHEEAK